MNRYDYKKDPEFSFIDYYNHIIKFYSLMGDVHKMRLIAYMMYNFTKTEYGDE